MAQNRYKAIVAGQTYTIIGQETKQHMDMVTALVNEQLNEIMSLSPEITQEKAAMLLAINAVSDQLKKQEALMQLEKQRYTLEGQAAHNLELENRIKKIEAIEAEAKEIMRKNGKENVPIRNHVEAQQIVNENIGNFICTTAIFLWRVSTRISLPDRFCSGLSSILYRCTNVLSETRFPFRIICAVSIRYERF